MRALLGTRASVWALAGPDKLSPKARQLLQDDGTDVVVSVASGAEIAAKSCPRQLSDTKRTVADYAGELPGLLTTEFAAIRGHSLQKSSKVARRNLFDCMPPFDCTLGTQSALEKLALISCDPTMRQFGVEVIC